MTELEHILDVHRRARRRSEAAFDVAAIGIALLVWAVVEWVR